jgi:hypothetical protein
MVNISKQHTGTSHGMKIGVVSAKSKEPKEKNPLESLYGRKLTVVIAVPAGQEEKALVCPCCTRMKVKTAVRSAPAWT